MKRKIVTIYGVLMLLFAVVISLITVCAFEIYSDYYSEEPTESSISFHSTALIPPASLLFGSAVGLIFVFAFGENDDTIRENSGKVGTYCTDRGHKVDVAYIFNTVGVLVGAFSSVILCIYDVMLSKLLK